MAASLPLFRSTTTVPVSDTIRLTPDSEKEERLTYQAQSTQQQEEPSVSFFNALIDGHFREHGALAGVRYFDAKDKLGVRIGAKADMESDGIRFKLLPERPTIGYKEFNLNQDNFIFLARNNRIQAKVDLIADDKTGVKVYTEEQDSTMCKT